jgi:purine-binding chemotaxis protein CheW
MATHEQAATLIPYLTFRLSGEEFALEILRVREIIRYERETRVPGAPPWIRGVINLRGDVVPVIDLCTRLGLVESPVTPRSCIVIVEVGFEGESMVMGVMADSVQQAVELTDDDLVPPPAFGARVRIDYLAAMAKIGSGLVLVLDLDRVLSARDLLSIASLESGLGTGAGVEAEISA